MAGITADNAPPAVSALGQSDQLKPPDTHTEFPTVNRPIEISTDAPGGRGMRGHGDVDDAPRMVPGRFRLSACGMG